MCPPGESPVEPSTSAWRRWERLLERFEQAWETGASPCLEDYLAGAGGNRLPLLVDLVHIDLEYRLRAGQNAALEDYLERYAELADHEDLVELIEAEFRQRCRWGQQPKLEDYQRRFPRHAETLAKQLNNLTTQSGRRRQEPGGPGPAAVAGYQILGELGRGGMGVVYQARHLKLNRLVALKMILAGGHASAADEARFLAEAETVASLQHPNIVQVYEVGQHEGRPYLELEYVAGGNLAERLKAGPLLPRVAAQLIEQLARGIDAAHQAGIVHRDLKPSNVLLQTADVPETATAADKSAIYNLQAAVPKITDFGLAKRVQSSSGLTQTGTVLGTPAYMAPEQAGGEGKRVGPAADVYALGAILYECLTGRPPFQGPTALETLQLVISTEPVSPSRLQPKLAPDLATICLKCLRKEPGQRYATAQELADDLHRFLEGKPVRARPVGGLERGWRWCRRNPWPAASVAGILLSLLAGTIVSLCFMTEAMRAAGRVKIEADNARANEQRALAQEIETRRQVNKLFVARGLELADRGDLEEALAWFARPLHADSGDPLDVDQHLQRLSNYQRYTRAAVLVQSFFHDDVVSFAAFSPAGERVVTASYDGSARVWDVASGLPVSAPLRHESYVYYAAFSPDGRRLVTAGQDGKVRLWDAATGQSLLLPLGGEQAYAATSFAQGRWLVATLGGNTARVWDGATGQPLTPPLQHKGAIRGASFSPNGRRLVTASQDQTARIWNVATGQPLTPPLHHAQVVLQTAFSPNGRQVVTSGGEYVARVWDAGTGKALTPLLPHRGLVNEASFSPDGRHVITASADGTARVWDAATRQPLALVLQHPGPVTHATFSMDGRRIVTTSGNQAYVWHARTGRPLTAPLRHQARVRYAGFSPDGRRVITTSEDRTARVWDLAIAEQRPLPLRTEGRIWHAAFSRDGRRVSTASSVGVQEGDAETGQPLSQLVSFHGDLRNLQNAALSADGKHVVSASVADKIARLWDTATGRQLTPPLGHEGFVWRVSFSPDSSRVATASLDRTARVWNVRTREPQTPPLAHGHAVQHVSFSPDGRRLVTGSGDEHNGAGRVWDAATGQPRTPTLRHLRAVRWAEFSPDGGRVVTASDDGTARVWDAATGQPVTPPLQHQHMVQDGRFSPDGRLVVTASFDGTARIWDATTGQPLIPPLKHQHWVHHAAFSPDGRRVVTASEDKTARVWDVASGQPVTPPLLHEGTVRNASFSPDGRWVLTIGFDQTARLWEIGANAYSRADWLQRCQFLVGTIDKVGALEPQTRQAMELSWQALKAKYPAAYSVPAERVLDWHHSQAQQCLREGSGPGYLLHSWYARWQWHTLTGAPLLLK
jgi:WD40 repeat protein/serine/threonine protein kinase